jgi:S-adenosyl methyltransferase
MTGEDGPRIDTSIAHPARRYNYWLGGKDHFQADRDSGDAIAAAFPSIRAAALANRAFMGRAVELLTRLGVRQFLDVGTGIPAPGNAHEVAQAIAGDPCVVYVDNDPIVMTHARALLTSTEPGCTAYLEADLREYEEILDHPKLKETIDLSKPVGLLLVAILHFIPDTDDPYGIVAGLMGRLAPGSYLVLSHGTMDFAPPENSVLVGNSARHGSIWPRSHAEVGRFLVGLEVLAPGIVSIADWRADDDPGGRLTPAEAGIYGVVARRH